MSSLRTIEKIWPSACNIEGVSFDDIPLMIDNRLLMFTARWKLRSWCKKRFQCSGKSDAGPWLLVLCRDLLAS